MPPTPVTSINIFCKLSFDNRLHAVGVGPCKQTIFLAIVIVILISIDRLNRHPAVWYSH